MSRYYRAALSAANAGNLTAALRLAQISIALGEAAPSAPHLLELLRRYRFAAFESDATQKRLRKLIQGRRYKKAAKIKLTDTSKGHTIKGMLYALLDRNRAARNEFAAALALDSGNDTALRALEALRAPRTRRKASWLNL